MPYDHRGRSGGIYESEGVLHEMQSVVPSEVQPGLVTRTEGAEAMAAKLPSAIPRLIKGSDWTHGPFLIMQFSGYYIRAVFAHLGPFSMRPSRERRFVPLAFRFQVTWNPGIFGAHPRPRHRH
jgi:hypothetical protein